VFCGECGASLGATTATAKTGYEAAAAAVARAEGRLEDALRLGLSATGVARTGSETSQSVKLALVEAIEAALALGDTDRAEELVASIEAVSPGLRSPYLGAQALRLRGRLAASEDSAFKSFKAAAKHLREVGVQFWLAVTLLEHAERLTAASRPSEAEPLLSDAREIFQRLEATPWLERVTAVAPRMHQAQVPA
jgi:hypothetical protein